MSTTVQPKPSLEERITSRLHESIGDLITDEDLKGMVARGIEAALFKPRITQTPRSYGGYDTTTAAPLVDEQVVKLLGEKMRAGVDAWLAANPEKIEAALRDVMQRGVGNALLYSLEQRFAGVFESSLEIMKSRGLLGRGPNG